MSEKLYEILSESVVFKGISMTDYLQIMTKANYQVRSYGSKSIIAQAGSNCDYARIVLSGKVSGEMIDLSGKILKIEELNRSSMIAPAFLYGSSRKYPVNVVSAADTEIWQMHRDDFSKLLQTNTQVLNNYLNSIANRAQFLSEKIRFLSFPSLRAKLAGLILHYSRGEKELQLPFTHQAMSEMFGVTRPSLSRALASLNAKCIISSDRNHITILDRSQLLSFLKS